MFQRHLTTFGTLGITLVAVLTGQPSFAQLVQIGPGYVKAPFVRVYTDEYGGTHVRAPFTSVYSPGYRNVVPPEGYYFDSTQRARRFGSPLATRSNPLGLRAADMNWQSLRRLAREGVAELNQELSRQRALQSWQDYLQTAAIGELVAADRNEPPPEEVRQQLEEILKSYDATLNTNNLRSIHGRPGFRKVHAALTALVVPPLAHQRRLVAASAIELRRELATMGSNGESWVSHLQLSAPIFADEAYDPGSDRADVEHEQLAEIISRFDAVSATPQYAVISELAGFRATYENLTAYRDMRLEYEGGEVQRNDVGGIEPVPLPIEELPAPPPNE